MRTPIELALSIRSYEQIVCFADPAADRDQYPKHWKLPRTMKEANIDSWTVAIVDRIEISPKVLGQIAYRKPRLIAFAVANVDHEKNVRRLIASSFPWSWDDDCVWTFSTDFARIIVTDAKGYPYDRSAVIDMRPEAVA